MKPNIGAGDSGETNILGGRRVQKYSPVVEALGDIDEAAAAIGLARAFVRDPARRAMLHDAQTILHKCAAEAASAGAGRATEFDFAAALANLDTHMRSLAELAPRPTEFLTPGEAPAEASLNLARAVVRRAERSLVAMSHAGPCAPPEVQVYLNRLSDLLFDLLYVESAGK
jgi:cob(I)alamin adenosyltransferase